MTLRIPVLGFFKPRNCYRLTLDDKTFYLGADKEAAESEYRRIVGQWLIDSSRPRLTLRQLVERFRAENPLSTSDRKLDETWMPILFAKGQGDQSVYAFGPARFKAFQTELVKGRGWCRSTVNRVTRRIKAMYRWAVEYEIVEPDISHKISAVHNLRYGEAKDYEKVKAVPVSSIEAIKPFVSETVRMMLEFQLLTGARPGEVCAMSWAEIDRDEKEGVWLFRPTQHKTRHRGKVRTIAIGPKAQAILSARKDKADKPFGIERDSYYWAVRAACRKANIEHFTPHQIRHTRATQIRKSHGIEIASAVLSHSSLKETDIYSWEAVEDAADIMRDIG